MKAITTFILVLACTLGFFARSATTAPTGAYSAVGVHGVILAFDHANEGLIMFNPRVGRIAVKMDDDWTRVLINQRPARLGDLRVGMHLVVSGPVTPRTHMVRARTIRVRQ